MTSDLEPCVPADSSLLERLGISPFGALAVVATVIVIGAIAPTLVFDAWTPRMAALLLGGVLGLMLLAKSAVANDRAAQLAAVLIGWIVVAGLVSDGTRAALAGTVGRDLSAFTVALSIGFWALGRSMTARDRHVLGVAFVAVACFSALIAVLQVVLQIETGSLALFGGRPTGTLTNPVYLGAVASAASIECLRLAQGAERRAFLAAAALLGSVVVLSGSRVAAAATVLVVGGWVLYDRRRDSVIGAAAIAFGMMVGFGLDRLFGSGGNAADRLADGGGASGRWTVWKYGWSAWRERPIFGHGMGRFRAAVQGEFSPEFVRDHAPDDLLQPWFDPHNVVVNIFVSIGVVGAVLVVFWLVLAMRGLNVRRAVVLLPFVLHWMLQPVTLFVLPVALLFLGGASAAKPTAAPSNRLTGLLVGLGAVLGLLVVTADIALSTAISSGNADRAAAIAKLTRGDAVVSNITSQLFEFSTSEGGREDSLHWQERAAHTEPDRPYWWTQLAAARLSADDQLGATEAAAVAIRLAPFNVRAWELEAVLAEMSGDEERFHEAAEVLCTLGLDGACGARLDG